MGGCGINIELFFIQNFSLHDNWELINNYSNYLFLISFSLGPIKEKE